MTPTEAQEISTSPDEVQDLQDDFVIHQQTEPEPEGVITKDIESNKPKRPRHLRKQERYWQRRELRRQPLNRRTRQSPGVRRK